MNASPAKQGELKQGDIVHTDDGFTCMPQGTKTVCIDEKGELYIDCDEGHHGLDGQLNEANEYVGITLIRSI